MVNFVCRYKKSFLDYSEITKHAIRVLSQEANISNGNIVDLACGDINLGYEEILFEIINGLSINNFNEGSSKWNFELRKWRYCILKYLRSRYSNLQVMLEKVSEIYDSTGYPEEMENFIIYMPPKCGYEPSLHTHEENMIRLALLLDEFLVNEKKIIGKM